MVIGLAIVTAFVAVACDPGFGVWFRNDSKAAVIVQFIAQDGHDGTGFPVEAGAIGGGYVGLGVTTWSAHVRVVASKGCRLLWEQDVRSSPSGVVIVDASGGYVW
jgi:hypothetical protein